MYDWIDNYRKDGLDGIRNRRKNAGIRAIISSAKNKEMTKDIVLNKSPTAFGHLKNTWSIRLLATYLSSSLLGMNVSRSQRWRIVHHALGMVYKQHQIKTEKDKNNDYEQKKNKIERYKKISCVLLKKDTAGI